MIALHIIGTGDRPLLFANVAYWPLRLADIRRQSSNVRRWALNLLGWAAPEGPLVTQTV